MLVYGDRESSVPAADLAATVADKIGACLLVPNGRPRHEALVTAFIQAAGLVQGLVDRDAEDDGTDDLTERQIAGGQLLKWLATAIDRSWTSGFAADLPSSDSWRQPLADLEPNGTIRVRQAEGYAFYALYPQSYVMAAHTSDLGQNTVVIGLRSIGTGLAALVAAAIDAPPALTLRPVGHPFARRISVTPALERMVLAHATADFAIVDEGPGLSGSTFGCVVDWLESLGIEQPRIHVFCSHRGQLGPQASERHRQRWLRLKRHWVDFDDLMLKTSNPAHRLQTWVSEIIGTEIDGWHDLSGGGWRALPDGGDKIAIPSDRQNEKRKFLASSGQRQWLVKFEGLGELGIDRFEKAQRLSEAGLTPRPLGLVHGFLVETWQPGIRLSETATDRKSLVSAIGRYLGFRARHLEPSCGGASLSELCDMAKVNTAELLGASAATRLGDHIAILRSLAPTVCPVDTDNRMHAWEWIRTPDGAIVKTDALDHSGAHDLVGCQDIAWDIAGAIVEFDLTAQERTRLCHVVAEATGYPAGEALIALYEILYLTFQSGLWSNAAGSQSAADADLAQRWARRYADRLADLLKA